MDEDWDEALNPTESGPARTDCPYKLSTGMLEPENLYKQGHTEQARESLKSYRGRISDPWYLDLSGRLLHPEPQAQVASSAGEYPIKILTGNIKLELWADGTWRYNRHHQALPGGVVFLHRPPHRVRFSLERLKRLRQVNDYFAIVRKLF